MELTKFIILSDAARRACSSAVRQRGLSAGISTAGPGAAPPGSGMGSGEPSAPNGQRACYMSGDEPLCDSICDLAGAAEGGASGAALLLS